MEKYNVLVVNQDFKSLHTIFDYLEEESIYNVMNATNSKMVQTIIRKKELDVVLLDWETSIASELEVYHYLQQQSSTKGVPIVISTHPARTQTINEIITTEISGYVPKPIEKSVLIKIINQAIEGHKETKAKKVAEKNALEQAKQQMLEEQNRIAQEKQKIENNHYAVLEEQKRLKNELNEARSQLANDKARLENEKKRLDLNQSNIASTKDQIEANQIDLQQKEEQLHLAKTTLLEEREAFLKEKQELAEEREKLLREQQELIEDQQYKQVEAEKQRHALEASQQHLEGEKQKLESEQQQIEKEKLRLQQQNEALEKEKVQIAQDKKEISSAHKSLRKQEALLAKSKTQELSEPEKAEAKDMAKVTASMKTEQSLEKLRLVEVSQKKENQPTNPKVALATTAETIEEANSTSELIKVSEQTQEQPLTKPEEIHLAEKTQEQAPTTPEQWVMEREQLEEMRRQLFKAKENFEEEKERFIQEKERILLENNKAREGSKELSQLQKSVLSAKDQLAKIERELTQKQAKLKLIEMEEKATNRSTSVIPQQLQRATEETLTTSDMALEGYSFSKLLEEEASRLHTSSLMQYILPEEIAKDLVKADYAHVNYYSSVSILYIGFADLMSTVLKADRSQLINELEVFFKTINDQVQEYGLERVRTKNNMYACAQRQLSAEDPMPLLKASFEIRQMALNYHSQSKQVNDLVKKMYLGVNTTDVVAGDTIHKRFAYDIWSDIIQTTYHLKKSADVPIHLLENTYKIVGDQINCEYVGKIRTNRRGDWKVYELISLR